MIIALPGIKDNEYTPVLKNTAMLTTMYHMMSKTEGQYDWVLKVDDDTLVNFNGFQFLSKLNPIKQKLYLGQQGMGDAGDEGNMGLAKPFCMGGPGYIISRAALNIVGPTLSQCARSKMLIKDHDRSWHSDVIVGKCMFEKVRIGCWDSSVSAVVRYRPFRRFFHKYAQADWLSGRKLAEAATLHPLKSPALMRMMYEKLRGVN